MADVEVIDYGAVVAKSVVGRDGLNGENEQQNAPEQHQSKDQERAARKRFHPAKLVEVLPAAKPIRQHSGNMADTPNVPLVVDLDGTVIRTDLLWELIARLLRRNPFAVFQIAFWWLRGRAWLKHQLAARVQAEPATLPYQRDFVAWLRKEKAAGRKIVLATASDQRMAQPVADHLGVFDEVMGSDGKTNLRAERKRAALVERFGERGFDYAGNSADDLMVWHSARQAIVVNAPPNIVKRAAACAEAGPTFCGDYRRGELPARFLKEWWWRSGYWLAAGAGLLLALAFPKAGIAGFAWVAPGLLLAAGRGQGGRETFWTGCAGGMAFWLASLYWLLLMPVAGLPILAWVALSAYCAAYFGLWVWLAGQFEFTETSWAGRTIWAMSGAAVWVALEWLRGQFLGGFPWSFLGVSQYQLTPLIQIAAVTGVYGVSFLMVWFSLALYAAARMIFLQPSRRQVWQVEIILPLLAVVTCYTGGFFAMNRAPAAERFVRVTAVQPSVPQTLIWNPKDDERRFEELLKVSQRALRADTNATELLVWPESAVPDIDMPTYDAILQLAQTNRVWIILNGEDVEFRKTATNFYNAAFLVGPDGQWRRQAYHKRELVIFGEYVPLANWLPFLRWFTPIQGGWTAGNRAAIFEMPRRPKPGQEKTIEISSDPAEAAEGMVKCSPLICFEDTFAGATRDSAGDGVDFLVNLTNDGWFGRSAEQRQHMANAVFRAVENGMPLLRCANNGVTCLINGNGRLEEVFTDAQHTEYGAGTFTVNVPLLSAAQKPAPTFYNRHGDWFACGCAAFAGLRLLAQRLNRKPAA